MQFVDYVTGELFDFADFDFSERQIKWLAEYNEWQEIIDLCTIRHLPLGVKEGARKKDFIERDFLWDSLQRGRLVGIWNPKPPTRRY